MFLEPLFALISVAVAWYLSGRQRWVRFSVPPHHRVIALVSAFLLVAALYVFVAEVPPDDASDNAWLIVAVPAWWCAIGALAFLAAALVPWQGVSRRLHAAALVLFTVEGVLAVGLLGIFSIAGSEKDLSGLPFRSRMHIATLIGAIELLAVSGLHFGLAHRWVVQAPGQNDP